MNQEEDHCSFLVQHRVYIYIYIYINYMIDGHHDTHKFINFVLFFSFFLFPFSLL